jgi:hypothetical protein
MSREEITATDRLLFDVEQALTQSSGEPGDPSISAELLAGRGLAGLTSVYVESFRAIDQLPKSISVRRLGRTALSDEAEDLIESIDQSIQLNPLYDGKKYSTNKLFVGYDKPRPWVTEPPVEPDYLTDRKYKDQFAELGLAAMYQSVTDGLSAPAPRSRQWRAYAPDHLQRTMIANKSIDPEIMKALAQANAAGNYSAQDYVTGLMTLANNTTQELVDNHNGLELYGHFDESEIIAMKYILGNTADFASGVSGGTSAIEVLRIIEGHHSLVTLALCVAGAGLAVVLRKVGDNLHRYSEQE